MQEEVAKKSGKLEKLNNMVARKPKTMIPCMDNSSQKLSKWEAVKPAWKSGKIKSFISDKILDRFIFSALYK